MSRTPRIAVIGAGLGGSAAATLMAKAGFDVKLYEKTEVFSRLGAGIHLGPNLMHVMRRVGIEDRLLATGSQPERWYSRNYKTGEIMAEYAFGKTAVERYGAPYLTVHRGDFHEQLVKAVPSDVLVVGKKLEKVEDTGKVVKLTFSDGSTEEADLVVGADGINSVVRETLLGAESPRHTGYAAHRAVFKTPVQSGGLKFDECCKWWGPDRHMMVYYVTPEKNEIYYVTGVPGGENWDPVKPWIPSSRDEMRQMFEGWHPTVQALIEGTEEVTLWPLFERDPLPLWSRGRLVLIGDACHPMKPHMGQGAAMAIEDAAMLTRLLQEQGFDNHEQTFRLYEANRSSRTAKVQQVSHDNTWLKTQENPDWCFGYNAFEVPLVDLSATA
ncbi:FAD-dependent monooxygenase [Burkholderia sp. BCC1977]|uniref:FAD-dependent monooxygenase n=1 Tax=Burkholderia sp. BCC1977 TaxID=2817440 RepID=UPI002ABD31B0|nr:FAD-dependent monooxygenase [Burkholderia sp. BCC1977]